MIFNFKIVINKDTNLSVAIHFVINFCIISIREVDNNLLYLQIYEPDASAMVHWHCLSDSLGK